MMVFQRATLKVHAESTSIALEEELLKELKAIASRGGVPYQVLMRLLIAEGVKRLKDAAQIFLQNSI